MPHFPSSSEAARALPTRTKSQSEQESRAKRILIKNRRKRYLDLHPEYFQEPHLELADPLLYDRLIRRFQTASEREREGKTRGYSRRLEADLVRSEAKIEAIEHPDPNSPLVYTKAADGSITGIEQNEEDRPTDQADGIEKWRDVMRLRFLRGEDKDFEYEVVDGNEEFDDREELDRDELEEYLDGEGEEFVGEGEPVGQTGIQDF